MIGVTWPDTGSDDMHHGSWYMCDLLLTTSMLMFLFFNGCECFTHLQPFISGVACVSVFLRTF